MTSDENGDSIKSKPIKAKTILLIEDDTVLAKMYIQKFSTEGYEVLHAHDGQEGLDLYKSKNIDMVITDIMLPRMSGIEFVEKIKQNRKKTAIPVIAWSNLANDEDKEKALKLGVKEYLVKGQLSLDSVVELVKKYI